MKDRAELYQEIKKFFKQEAEPLLKKYEKERKELEEAGNSYEEMLKNYIEENKEEEHTGTKKADTDAGKESIKDGFEKGSRVY